ncbi:SET domain protein [Mariniflexile rhizosphaerae]|uniref:SET domain-containing protein n=1 Tax=unclassified Mariniflexile TaxID=2643887 RepID=UPI000CB0E02B|nr:SET domain-containing protein [Mariniflexile sp. TRM1-10]AXP79319.1 SET domain protein [Mariniflexile sp. TRM1-10]PLB20325.1 MAG: SET domain-containing protein [Flavobacteriaceae bacterium FS1-H7996/R]
MIHPNTEVRFISKEKGYGVVATKLIPKGTITWVQDDLDQVFTRDQVANLNPFIKKHLDTYSFTNKKGEKVLCWDNGKFVNHSFRPSCFSTPYDFEIAIRDIHPGDELTDDYGYLNVEMPFEAMDEGTDRKTVYPNDILRFHKEWDILIKENAPKVFEVEQSLIHLIPKETWTQFMNAVQNPNQMKSILECHYYHTTLLTGTTHHI